MEKAAKNLVFILLPVLFFLAGCSTLKETGRKIWGSSIEHLERSRSEALARTFTLSLLECFDIAERSIRSTDAEVYLEDREKRYMAVMKFKGHVDTTQAGVFFTVLSDSRTKVEVSSMSPRLRDDVAALVFEALSVYRE